MAPNPRPATKEGKDLFIAYPYIPPLAHTSAINAVEIVSVVKVMGIVMTTIPFS